MTSNTPEFHEKKWFVYLSDHHEGPYSVADIGEKLSRGLVTPSSYLWTEGMAKWAVMTEVPDFNPLLGSSASAPTMERTRPELILPSVTVVGGASRANTSASAALSAAPKTSSVAAPSPKMRRNWRKIILRSLGAGATLSIVGGIGALYVSGALDSTLGPGVDRLRASVFKWTGSLPLISRIIPPISRPSDVSDEDYAELKEAAGSSAERDGPKLAAALVQGELVSPAFYLSTNLPDHSQLTIYLEGVADTLVDRTSFFEQQNMTIVRKLGRTAPFKGTDSKGLPRGQYRLYALEGLEQPDETRSILSAAPAIAMPGAMGDLPFLPKGIKAFVQKTVFLGGPKDMVYQAKLKEFHDHLRTQATTELEELKMFAESLGTVLDQTVKGFERSRTKLLKAKNAAERKRLSASLRPAPDRFFNALVDKTRAWTAETYRTEKFYGMLYERVALTSADIVKVKDVQLRHFTSDADAKSLEIQLGEAVSAARESLNQLQSKVERAAALQPTPNGMPQKDGL